MAAPAEGDVYEGFAPSNRGDGASRRDRHRSGAMCRAIDARLTVERPVCGGETYG